MILHILVLIFFNLNLLISNASSATFSTCLLRAKFTNDELEKILYTPKSTNYTPILLQTIRNSRFNTSQTLKPTLILTPFQESQVQEIVKCAKKNRLHLKIRSGGHDFEGLSYTSKAPFAILDMSNLRSIKINLPDKTAWVQSGATIGELYYRIWEKSKTHAFPAGVSPSVGIGGHISGGGYGNMIRKYGLTVDNVVDAKIVDANGFIHNRKGMGEDLFWAIRGGGGASFGVVLSYKIKLVHVPPFVTIFQVLKTLEDNAMDIVHRWQYVADKLDKKLFIRVNLAFHGKNNSGASFQAMYLGNSTKLVSLMNKHFSELGLKKEDCKEMSWIKSVFFWAELPEESPETDLLIRKPSNFVQYKVKSDYVRRPITKEGLQGFFKKIASLGHMVVKLNPYGGRMSEIAESATPYPHRAGIIYKIQYFTWWSERGDIAAEKKYLDYTREVYDYMTPFVSKNPREAFLNYRDIEIGSNDNDGVNDHDEGRVYGVKYFKCNFDRLVQVKTKVDPDNFFRDEQSIPVLKNDRYSSYIFL